MRRVVVLPAPLGPSRPVISPSRAVKPTPCTALTGPVLAAKLLWRSCTSIIGLRLPAVETGEGHRVGHGVQAFGIELARVGGIDESREQLGHAADRQDVVAL